MSGGGVSGAREAEGAGRRSEEEPVKSEGKAARNPPPDLPSAPRPDLGGEGLGQEPAEG